MGGAGSSRPPTADADRATATYRVRAEAATIEARARAIALEQSVELPLELIDDPVIRAEIVGQVADIRQIDSGAFEVRISLAASTMPPEPGQMMNMLFGNVSLHEDVALTDVELPAATLAALGGPRLGVDGLRALAGAGERALTATALKPQGLEPKGLARLAHALALGGLDVVKDDHGLADQSYSPFRDRVAACAEAVRLANASTGGRSLYAPSLSGSLDALREQLRVLRAEGVVAALVAPMIVGLPAFHAIAREADGIALLAHPSFAGASRIAPSLLLGKLFRLLGADAVIFPNHGGRFSYSSDVCRRIAEQAVAPLLSMQAAVPTPAGGMTLDRVEEMLQFYGRDCMLLIGGSLLAERQHMTDAARRFADRVARHEG